MLDNVMIYLRVKPYAYHIYITILLLLFVSVIKLHTFTYSKQNQKIERKFQEHERSVIHIGNTGLSYLFSWMYQVEHHQSI